MKWLCISIDDKGKIHQHTITASNIWSAIERAEAFYKGAYRLMAVINPELKNKLKIK